MHNRCETSAKAWSVSFWHPCLYRFWQCQLLLQKDQFQTRSDWTIDCMACFMQNFLQAWLRWWCTQIPSFLSLLEAHICDGEKHTKEIILVLTGSFKVGSWAELVFVHMKGNRMTYYTNQKEPFEKLSPQLLKNLKFWEVWVYKLPWECRFCPEIVKMNRSEIRV